MSKIQILPDILASQVAAGEVVERPASVVKELVENSLDAGASHILVEIHRGGSALIRITDNGCGMSEQDALMSLERHATSKLRSADDLMNITTMGFRGEAVPSIASVSQFRISSQEKDAIEGVEIRVNGGKISDVKKAGLSVGTCMEVKQLFYNVPARRKFLKAESTESAHVEHQLKLHALSASEARFTFKKDSRVVFDLPATKDRKVRIAGLMGGDISGLLIEVKIFKAFNMQVSGYVMPAEHARKGKRQQYIFLNGRPIEDAAISRAIRDGFGGSLADGLQPSCWLWLQMDASLVDVNVHPAKREVRFQKSHEVRMLVTQAIEKSVLPEQAQHKSIHSESHGQRHGFSEVATTIEEINRKPLDNIKANTKWVDKEETASKATGSSDMVKNLEKGEAFNTGNEEECLTQKATGQKSWAQNSTAKQEELLDTSEDAHGPAFATLAVLHDQYILMQGDEGLVVLDPKAARERIVYETIIASEGSVISQGLLLPEIIELDAYDFDIVSRNLERFRDAGIQIETFSGNSFQVSGIPDIIHNINPRQFIIKLIDELIATQETQKGKVLSFDLFAKRIAKRVSYTEKVELEHTEALLTQLFRCQLPYCDPSGEPTMVQIALSELARKFGKK